jgi:hypothetical protein
MIKAQKYIRHYCIDFVHGKYGQTPEIFIPEYGIAINIIDDIFYVILTNKPENGCPVKGIVPKYSYKKKMLINTKKWLASKKN